MPKTAKPKLKRRSLPRAKAKSSSPPRRRGPQRSKVKSLVPIEKWRSYAETKSVDLRNEIVVAYMPFATTVARRAAQRWPVDADDLQSIVCEALISVVERFDADRGYKFETYAAPRMTWAIVDWVRERDHLSRLDRTHASELDRNFAELTQRLGRPPTQQEFEDEFSYDFSAAISPPKIVKNSPNPDDTPLIEFAAAKVSDSGWRERDYNPLATRAALAPDQRVAVYLYLFKGLTMKAVGGVLQLSESRISQLISEAVVRLRKAAENS